jgi:hypothetical protein
MLAKHAWRLLTEPESLYARVLKARYIRETSVLDAKPIGGTYILCDTSIYMIETSPFSAPGTLAMGQFGKQRRDNIAKAT